MVLDPSSRSTKPPNVPNSAAPPAGWRRLQRRCWAAPRYSCSISHHSARSAFLYSYLCCSLSHSIHVSMRASSTTNPGLDHTLPSDQNISAGADLLLCSPTSIAMTRFFEYHRGAHPCSLFGRISLKNSCSQEPLLWFTINR